MYDSICVKQMNRNDKKYKQFISKNRSVVVVYEQKSDDDDDDYIIMIYFLQFNFAI